MKVLYVGLKHDYGHPERGLDYGYYNTFESLREMADGITLLDLGVVLRGMPRWRFDRRLRDTAAATRPDVIFFGLFRNEVAPKTLDHLRGELGIPTLAWFADDQWRFESHTQRYAPHLSWCVTTAAGALPKYRALGVGNVIKSQWACNPFRYKPAATPLLRDVSFVGQPHGDRRRVVERLEAAGIPVDAYGQGWPNGRISQEDMIRLFSGSKVNLNLANASTSPHAENSGWGKLMARLARLPAPEGLRAWGRRLARAAAPPTAAAGEPLLPQQIKGRNFEIPACGGFTLTSAAEELEDCYRVGKEVACYRDVEELADQIRHYLGNEPLRQDIARAGHKRTLQEHTWFHRFEAIFRKASIRGPSAADVLARGPRPGRLTEVFP